MTFAFGAALAAFLATVGGPVPQAQAAAPAVQQTVPLIEPSSLHALIAAHVRLAIVDVRQPEEFAQGHIAGAVLMPLANLAAIYTQIPKDVKLVVYCRSGHRSAKAVEFLLAHGYSRALSLDGGFTAWAAQGY